MTFEERAQAVEGFGFTPRQAAFLTTVMLHSGVCLPRQYTRFAGIVFGHNTRDFFAKLTREKFATAYECWKRQGTYYHVHHKGLYRAIGQTDNRHRRRPTIPRTAERLMLLDAVLSMPGVNWLATESEKVEHFIRRYDGRIEMGDLPGLVFERGGQRTTRYFPDKLPIGLVSGSEVFFVYVVTEPNPEPVRRFIRSQRVLERMYGWCLRLFFPGHLAGCQGSYRAAVRELLAPAPPYRIVDEFKWYCEARRALEQGAATPAPIDQARYARARRAFRSPRFQSVYREWLSNQFMAIARLQRAQLHEMFEAGKIRIETQVLTHRYLSLSTTAATA